MDPSFRRMSYSRSCTAAPSRTVARCAAKRARSWGGDDVHHLELAEHLLARAPDPGELGVVDADDRPGGVERVVAAGRVVVQVAHLLRRPAHSLFRPLALGDVVRREQHAPAALQLDQLQGEQADARLASDLAGRFEIPHVALSLEGSHHRRARVRALPQAQLGRRPVHQRLAGRAGGGHEPVVDREKAPLVERRDAQGNRAEVEGPREALLGGAQRRLGPRALGDLAMQPRVRVDQLRGALADPGLQIHPEIPQRQVGPDAGEDLLRLEGLDDVVDRAAGKGAHLVDHLVGRADEDDRNAGGAVVRPEARADLVAVHGRHHHVEQDQIRQGRPQKPQRQRTFGGRVHGVPLQPQHPGEQVEVRRGVVDDQDAALGGNGGNFAGHAIRLRPEHRTVIFRA